VRGDGYAIPVLRFTLQIKNFGAAYKKRNAVCRKIKEV